MHTDTPDSNADADSSGISAEQEKRAAARSSIYAALLLTGLKLGVGLATNSLGILSEALHSGLDMLAAGITYAAVRYSAFPPDPGHPYGHGKIENLSAMVEALLLFITCAWIIWEAADRLFFTPAPVTLSWWAFGIMVISIIVDYSRSRMLSRVAKKHNSQALEADSLHFSTDILSSFVVILGLSTLYLADFFPQGSLWREWLQKADALAALAVAAIVLYISYTLGRRAVNVLLDAGDAALSMRLQNALSSLPGIRGQQSLRLRHSGPDLLVDMTVTVDNDLQVQETSQLREAIVDVVHKEEARARVSVYFAPHTLSEVSFADKLRAVAAAYGLKPHSIELIELEDEGTEYGERRRLAEMHVELPPDMPLQEAHDMVSAFEARMRESAPRIILVTHIEPEHLETPPSRITGYKNTRLTEEIKKIAAAHPAVRDCHSIIVRYHRGEAFASLHCRMPEATTVKDAHQAASDLQAKLNAALPELKSSTVHMEPFRAH